MQINTLCILVKNNKNLISKGPKIEEKFLKIIKLKKLENKKEKITRN